MLLFMNAFVLGFFVTPSVAETGNDEHSRTYDKQNEYCQLETFSPRCWKNEIILIESATYGRMRTGRCLEDENSKLMDANKNDPQYLGCSVDVLAILDRRCSGKNQCDVRLPDSELANTKPCYKGLETYLEAKYNCINVAADDRTCMFPATSTPQHILGYSSSSLGCGRKTQPWIIEAPAGQRINITMVEFNGVARRNANQRCDQYGFILEKSHKKNASICYNLGRESNVYFSISNIVEIVSTVDQDRDPKDKNGDSPKIILRFEAIGCSDLVPPEDAWLKRSTDEAIVGCYSSRQTWQLRCNGHQWIGVLGNCSHAMSFEALKTTSKKTDYQVLGLVAICGIGLAICLTIVCTGAICIKKFQKNDASRYHTNHKTVMRNAPVDPEIQNSSLQYPNTMKSQHPTYAVYGGSDGVNCNGSYNRTDPTQYFVLDPEVIAREQLLQ